MLENIHISPDDVKQAIKQLKPNKAPGPNLFGTKLFKEASNELATPLSDLYNLSLTTKTYPTSWKKANVCPIFKKDNPCKPNTYRPISLLNYEGKIMERCVHKHISEYLEENTIISEYQSGFKPTDSTINQLAYLCNEFAKAIDESKEIRVVFLDISKAFDRVWHKGLLAKLRAIDSLKILWNGFLAIWKTVNKGSVFGVLRLLGYQFSQEFLRDLSLGQYYS